MRSLKTNYRATNVYRFVRETLPETKSFTLIDKGSNYPKIGYLNFDDLTFEALAKSVDDFGSLFARYKVDKIVTMLTPVFQEVVQQGQTDSTYAYSPSLRITRVNTKWFDDAWSPAADSDDQLQELAQIQSKTVSNYASHRNLNIVTVNPGVSRKGVLDASGAEINFRGPMPWLNCTSEAEVPMKHNSLIIAERTDGEDLTVDWKYRIVHKVYFRCAQVG